MKKNILVFFILFISSLYTTAHAGVNEELFYALRFGTTIEQVRQLLSKGADVRAKDSNNGGKTPLHAAVSTLWESVEITRLLLEKGADVNAKDNYGDTPLHAVALASKETIQKLSILVEKGADINAKNRFGMTPLHKAVENNLQMAIFLIERGADVNTQKYDGETPLHAAVKTGYIPIVKLLIEKGANVDAKALDLATKKGQNELANLLQQHIMPPQREELINLTREISSRRNIYMRYNELKATIKLSLSLTPPPVIPEEAKKKFSEGVTAFELARKSSDYEEPKKKFEEAVFLAPWWADAYFNLSLTGEKLRDWQIAITALELYLIAAPNAPDADAMKQKIHKLKYLMERKKEAEKHINRGAELFNSKDYQESIRENKEAIRLDPEYARAYANLGSAYVKLERYQEAIPELKEAIRLGERVPYVYSNLGFAYKRLGDIKNAISILEEGVRENEHEYYLRAHGEIHERLARYYDENGQYEKALVQFQEALKYTDSDKEVDKKYVQEMITNLKSRLGK